MDLVVIDASFISMRLLLPAVAAVLKSGGQLVAMVKPQFEVQRHQLKKGVVKDPEIRQEAIDRVAASAGALNFVEIQRCDSSLAGPEGNVEAFLHLRV